jgi:O-antigen/teichoic acid export membrane protein
MVNKIIQGFKFRLSDPFWKSVAILFSGSALAQALPILILPIITRIYPKEALGFYFVYVGITMLTQIVASLQFQLAIVLPKDKEDAYKLLNINLILVFGISATMLLGIWVFFDFMASFIEQSEMLFWLYAVPFSTLFLGVFNALSYFLNRERKYKILSISKISKSLTFSIFHIIFGILGFLKSGLILGLIIGQIVSMVFLIYFVIIKMDFKFRYKFSELKEVFLKYKDIPLFNTIISILNTLSNQLPLFLLARFFGVRAAGDYGLANRMVTTPMGLISQSVGQVFYQEAAAIQNSGGSLESIIKTTYKRLFKIGIVPFIILAALAPWLFKIAFSADYISSGEITRYLIPWLFVMFLNSPLTYIITVLNKQRQMIIYDSCLLGARFLALYLGYSVFNNLFSAVFLFSAVGFTFNVFLLLYFWQISKQPIVKVYD